MTLTVSALSPFAHRLLGSLLLFWSMQARRSTANFSSITCRPSFHCKKPGHNTVCRLAWLVTLLYPPLCGNVAEPNSSCHHHSSLQQYRAKTTPMSLTWCFTQPGCQSDPVTSPPLAESQHSHLRSRCRGAGRRRRVCRPGRRSRRRARTGSGSWPDTRWRSSRQSRPTSHSSYTAVGGDRKTSSVIYTVQSFSEQTSSKGTRSDQS